MLATGRMVMFFMTSPLRNVTFYLISAIKVSHTSKIRSSARLARMSVAIISRAKLPISVCGSLRLPRKAGSSRVADLASASRRLQPDRELPLQTRCRLEAISKIVRRRQGRAVPDRLVDAPSAAAALRKWRPLAYELCRIRALA
jgi:hypothetical protein